MNNYEIMMNDNLQIGEQAPEFEATTTMGNIKLNDYKGKWVVLFSFPNVFTPVCTTEIIAFAKANAYFNDLNTQLLGLSIDSNSSHLAWVYDIYLKTGMVIPFPIIADRNGEIARKYGMIANNVSTIEATRHVFIIDDKGIIKAILVYPMSVGRAIPEILRVIEALQIAEKNKVGIPANWSMGKPVINASPKDFNSLQKREQEIQENKNGMSWYLSFNDINK